MKKLVSMALAAFLFAPGSGRSQTIALERGFKHLPDSVKPGCYYYWINDNVNADGVVKDIQAMARVGIGRAYIGNVGFDGSPKYGAGKLFSDIWWKATTAAVSEGTRQKVDIGLFNSPGWSQSGGPWIKSTEAMRYLDSREIVVEGPKTITQAIPVGALWQDVAVMAYPVPVFFEDDIRKHGAKIQTDMAGFEVAAAMDGDTLTEAVLPEGLKSDVSFVIEATEPMTARSLVLYPGKRGMQADIELRAVDATGHEQVLRHFHYDRSNAALNVGFRPFAPIAVSFPAVTAKRYRLVLMHIQGRGSLAEIRLGAAAINERYEEKQLAKMFQTPLPLWHEYQWEEQSAVSDAAAMVDPSAIVDISNTLSGDGVVKWNVPAGKWVIVRYGMAPTGVTNSPATPEGTGYDVDKMSKKALEGHWDAWFGKIQERIPAGDRASLKYIVADSYETGSQNWTDDMVESFQKAYGYDPKPWLPALNGRVVGDAGRTDRFLWDLRRLVADKVAYDYVGGLKAISNRHGVKLWLENYGHWGYPSEFLKYGGQSDEIGGEFWAEGDLGSIECRDASSAAHIYGKQLVSAESFTSGGRTYVRYPSMLKRRGDWSFTEGINNTILHVYIHQPNETKPGINQWFGTEFNRHNTWFEQGKAFVDYIRRCNYMLRQGRAVNDVAYFIGEDAPKMTGIREPALPKGLQFDYINAEVIESRLSVKDGWIVSAEGVRYRMLVLPKLATMRPELLAAIETLVKDGAVVMGPPPSRSPSLQDYPAADARVQALASKLWAGVDGVSVKYARYGKGMIIRGMDMTEAMSLVGLKPDFVAETKDSVLYTHRSVSDAEIYFVSNQEDRTIRFEPVFRDGAGFGSPRFWDAVTGETRALPEFSAVSGGVKLPLVLAAGQSCFVVFEKGKAFSVGKNFPEAVVGSSLRGPWTVRFDPAMRGPLKPVVFDTLVDWSLSLDAMIRDYSGSAVYTTSFSVGALPAGKDIYIDLGSVKAMGTVKLNGKVLGTVWTAPYRVKANGVIRSGENKLEVEVVNTWVNRLIGDSGLPEGDRKTWSNVNSYKPDSKRESSGLLGPVTIKYY